MLSCSTTRWILQLLELARLPEAGEDGLFMRSNCIAAVQENAASLSHRLCSKLVEDCLLETIHWRVYSHRICSHFGVGSQYPARPCVRAMRYNGHFRPVEIHAHHNLTRKTLNDLLRGCESILLVPDVTHELQGQWSLDVSLTIEEALTGQLTPTDPSALNVSLIHASSALFAS